MGYGLKVQITRCFDKALDFGGGLLSSRFLFFIRFFNADPVDWGHGEWLPAKGGGGAGETFEGGVLERRHWKRRTKKLPKSTVVMSISFQKTDSKNGPLLTSEYGIEVRKFYYKTPNCPKVNNVWRGSG